MTLIMYAAVSIDGIAALDSKTGIERNGSPEDREFFLAGAKSCQAVIMGKNTGSFRVFGVPNFILTHDPAGAEASQALDARGVERVYLCGQPQEICAKLEARGIQKAALLGGPSTNLQFLRAGLVDEIFLTVEPVTIGCGIRFLNEPLESRWILADSQVLNERGTIVLHYKKHCAD